mmetsp:Transcript_125544/g.298142  ORF Transcript_125544/g.298142 Transcript_125544/m.298142 type:complete len:314 (-) Transcript_125544:962-1903(-)
MLHDLLHDPSHTVCFRFILFGSSPRALHGIHMQKNQRRPERKPVWQLPIGICHRILQLATIKAPGREGANGGVHSVLICQERVLHAHRQQPVEHGDVQALGLCFLAEDRSGELALIAHHHGLDGPLAERKNHGGLDDLSRLVNHDERKGLAVQRAHAAADACRTDHIDIFKDGFHALVPTPQAALLEPRLQRIRLFRRAKPHSQHLDTQGVQLLCDIVTTFVAESGGEYWPTVALQPTADDGHCRGGLPCAWRTLNQSESAPLLQDHVPSILLRLIQILFAVDVTVCCILLGPDVLFTCVTADVGFRIGRRPS